MFFSYVYQEGNCVLMQCLGWQLLILKNTSQEFYSLFALNAKTIPIEIFLEAPMSYPTVESSHQWIFPQLVSNATQIEIAVHVVNRFQESSNILYFLHTWGRICVNCLTLMHLSKWDAQHFVGGRDCGNDWPCVPSH